MASSEPPNFQHPSLRQHRRRHPDLTIDTSPPTATATAPSHRLQDTPPRGHRPPAPPSLATATSSSAGAAAASKSPGRALRPLNPSASHAHADASFLDNASPVEPFDMSNKENVGAPGDGHSYGHDYGQGQAQGHGNGLARPARPRDSHDLSLPTRNVTRDSLMANMLMSLDQFSIASASNTQNSGTFPGAVASADSSQSYQSYPYDAEGDGLAKAIARQDRRNPNPNSNSNPNAHGHNNHGYSYSSDFDAADDSSRYSSQPSRGRRSNSSSNFAANNSASAGRYNGRRESMHSTAGTPRNMHTRGGGKSSKSSSINSVDAGYVQVLGSQRWAHGFGRRLSSFDFGQQHRPVPAAAAAPIPASATAPHPTAWNIDFSNAFPDDYDAAPTPTIPNGPRRPPTTQSSNNNTNNMGSFPPPPPEPESREPALERKRSSLSTKSTSANNRRNDAKYSSPQRDQMPPHKTTHQPASSSASDFDSAPAPHVGYGKAKEPANPSSTTNQQPPVKERPGFFRRVFGSSKNTSSPTSANNNSNNNIDSRNAFGGSVSSNTGDSTNRRQASQAKSQSTPPSRDTSSSHSHHPVLQKKPSSFFRRRKKSVVEEAPPPVPTISTAKPPIPPVVPPLHLQPTKEQFVVKPEPSPVSSLRQVMTPYLKSSPAGIPHGPPPNADALRDVPDDPEEARQYQRSFSPDYEPSPNARIREVKPESGEEDTSASEAGHHHDTPTRPPPAVPRPSAEKRNNSFLNLEGSDNEGDGKTKTKSDKRTGQSKKPSMEVLTQQSPTSHRKKEVPGRLKIPRSDQDQAESEEEEGRQSNLVLPLEGARSASPVSASTGTDYKSALQTPSVQVEDTPEQGKGKPLDEPEFVLGDPTDDDRQKAKQIFDGNEDFIQKEKAAAWMGEEGPVRQRTLRAYMELYDFSNKSVVQALRLVCQKLVLRAETQQVDRVLVAFSKRWCDCNPKHGFKASDVIHTICYSIMLLNTDLHLADIETKMTRNQFIKNTMMTIRQSVAESAADAFKRPSLLTEKNGLFSPEDYRSPSDERPNRFSFKPPPKRDAGAEGTDGEDVDGCGPLVKAPFEGTQRAWETQVEVVLKDIYTLIRDERLPLFGAEPSRNVASASQSNLSVMGMLKRSPSVLSKAPSEGHGSMRGRYAESSRTGTGRFVSKSRSRPRLGNPGFSSSRTSFDDNNSMWSPAGSAVSATWSKYSLGRTQTSMSVDSFGAHGGGGDYQQSIGFANALSQAIIRDDASGIGPAPSVLSDEANAGNAALLEDDSLELAGPPWIKEGMVTHKHHLDGVDKKAKDRNWGEVFAVVQKGQMSLFSFSANKSLGRKHKAARNRAKQPAGGAPVLVGGGNWQDNATNLGTFSLRQTIASALPAPGYSRARPHVWALSLPTGAVHLFQVGTPEICREFVTTANYWSARLSTHPLVGGVSNMEYGWSDSCINNALVAAINETTGQSNDGRRSSRPGSSTARPSTNQGGGRASTNSIRSFRSASLDIARSGATSLANAGVGGNKLPGDRIHVAEWAPPTQSMRPSNLPESEQLSTLVSYVKGVEDELQEHNRLRSPMLLAFTPRGTNAGKAMANWERKSAYLLREIVKFRTYVDCLQQAEMRKGEIYAERELARRAARGELSDGEVEAEYDERSDAGWRGDRDEPARVGEDDGDVTLTQ